MKIDNDCFADEKAIDKMVSDLGGVNKQDDNGMTPLCYAALNGIKPNLIVYLINNKHANPDKQCKDETTPLQNAIIAGSKESIDALVGNDVLVYDSKGDTVDDKSSPAADQPKKDAVGNPLPERDADGNIVYQYYNNVLVPLNEGEKYISDKYQQRCKINNKAVFVPPPSPNLPKDQRYTKITYILDKDGNHSPMRDKDGKPIKQCYSTSDEIHKIDENGKALKNNYEYVWDYEGLPKYKVAYNPKKVHANSQATVDKNAILSASAKPNAEDATEQDTLLDALIHTFCECTGSTHRQRPLKDYKDKDGNVPIFLAVAADSIPLVDLLLQHDNNRHASVNYFNDAANNAAALAISIGNEEILSKLKQFMHSVSDWDDIKKIEEYITDEDVIPKDGRSDCIGAMMPIMVNLVYASSVYSNVTSRKYTTMKLSSNIDIDLPDTKTILDYAEIAINYLPPIEVLSLHLAILNGFITDNTAKDISTSAFPLIKKKCYAILNMLYENNKFDDVTVVNTVKNQNAIAAAVESGKLEADKLNNWPWSWLEDDVTPEGSD